MSEEIEERCFNCKHWIKKFHTLLGWMGLCNKAKLPAYGYSSPCPIKQFEPITITVPEGTSLAEAMDLWDKDEIERHGESL